MRIQGLTLRQAALTAGFAYLLNPVAYAEFSIYPKLVVPGNVEQTVANIASHHGLFITAMLFYFLNFIGDIIIAWALYILLAPVNQALSLLGSLFQLVYAAVALGGMFNLATVYRMLTTPEYFNTIGAAQLHAQVNLLLHIFRYNYSLGVVIFAIHLLIVGYLIVRSSYIPSWLGIILIVNGLGWIVNNLRPYLYPEANLGFVFITFFGELIFMLWLLIRGWKIEEPEASNAQRSTLTVCQP
jgi:Domain of unknown function (DUF4386)